jgi:HSP20 family molecular chaperone IbpA
MSSRINLPDNMSDIIEKLSAVPIQLENEEKHVTVTIDLLEFSNFNISLNIRENIILELLLSQPLSTNSNNHKQQLQRYHREPESKPIRKQIKLPAEVDETVLREYNHNGIVSIELEKIDPSDFSHG